MVGVPRSTAGGCGPAGPARPARAARTARRSACARQRGGRRPVVLSHVAVAVARELDDPPPRARAVRELLAVHDRATRARTAPTSPRRARAAASRPRPSTRRTAGPVGPTCSKASRRTSIPADCTQSTSRICVAAALHGQPVDAGTAAPASGGPTPGKRHAEGCWRPGRVHQARARDAPPAARARAPSRSVSAAPAVSSESSFSSRQPAPAARGHQVASRSPPSRGGGRARSARPRSPKRSRTASARAVARRRCRSPAPRTNARGWRKPSPGTAAGPRGRWC